MASAHTNELAAIDGAFEVWVIRRHADHARSSNDNLWLLWRHLHHLGLGSLHSVPRLLHHLRLLLHHGLLLLLSELAIRHRLLHHGLLLHGLLLHGLLLHGLLHRWLLHHGLRTRGNLLHLGSHHWLLLLLSQKWLLVHHDLLTVDDILIVTFLTNVGIHIDVYNIIQTN